MIHETTKQHHTRITDKILPFAALASCLFLSLTLAATNLAAADFEGALQSVSITDAAGSNSPPVADFTYTQNGETFTFDADGSYDPDGSIVEYKWNIGDGTTTTEGSNTTTKLTPGEHAVTLTVIDNSGGVAIAQSLIFYAAGPDYFINFQPETVAVPAGFQADIGSTFDDSAGYGWNIYLHYSVFRERNSSLSPDKTYDTMVHVDNTRIWEIAVPNGNYSVTICNGDAKYPQGVQNVQAEGTTVIDNKELSTDNRWVEGTAVTSVSDGKLTITFTGSTNPARLCWLTITSL